jgi:modulator of FtsH protease HflC
MRIGSQALLLGASIIAAAAVASGSYFRVRQNEVAYIARFGKVVNPQAGPLQPGLHFKLPLVDEADTISVSTDTIKMPVMKAFTRDTQEVLLQLSLTYNVPSAAAYHLLYEVGRAGNIDINFNLESVANDRMRSIVSRRDVTELAGEGRERIVDEIKTVIASELKRLFKVDVQDVQIPTLDFSSQYKEAVNRATLARAQRVQAEQDRERARVEAETVVVKAKGEADSQFARAEGAARARLAQARAEAEATKLSGEAEAAAMRVKIEATGGVDGYTRQLQAQAALNWKGALPQVMTAGGNLPMILPLQLGEKK